MRAEAHRSGARASRVRSAISPQGSGEVWVWIAAAGLATGILMTLGLLLLIAVKGTTVFWPRDIVQLQLAEAPPGIATEVVAGEVVSRRARVDRASQPTEHPDRASPREWQLYIGNKETYGLGFVYVPEATIRSIERPPDLLVAERRNLGNLIGYPVELELAGGNRLTADSPRFESRLRGLVAESRDRWAEIRAIERGEIGEINARMEELRILREGLQRRNRADRDARLETVDSELQDLDQRFRDLASQAAELRDRQTREQLHYRLPSGEERSVALGQLTEIRWPNRMNLLEKIGSFFAEVWQFVSEEPRESNTEGGVFPAIFGTFVLTLLMTVVVMPFGVVGGIYLHEYARGGFLVRWVRISVNNLAGVPSIIFGVFGLGFLIYLVGGTIDALFYPDHPSAVFGTGGILWASITLAIMTVPVVIVATEESLRAVPRGMREAAAACGASKWQALRDVVLPAAAPGVLTGLILAMARGAGEVAPLMLVGAVKLAPSLPVDLTPPYIHLERKFMHLGYHIYDLGFQSPDAEAAKPMVFATTLLLILIVVCLNLLAIAVRGRLRFGARGESF